MATRTLWMAHSIPAWTKTKVSQKNSESTRNDKFEKLIKCATKSTTKYQNHKDFRDQGSCILLQTLTVLTISEYETLSITMFKNYSCCNYCCMQINTDKNNYKGFEARSWAENMKLVFFILCYCLIIYSLSWNAPAHWRKFHSLPPLFCEKKPKFSTAVQWKKKSDKLLYLFNKSLFNSSFPM